MPPLPFAAEFLLFAATLLGIACLHHRTLPIALLGLLSIIAYKWLGPGFAAGPGLAGLGAHFAHEWVTLANLLCLLLGFELLARDFESSHVPQLLPHYLPDDWKGPLVLLGLVFVLSSFLDNIAAALIGGAMAHTLFNGRVHIGYVAGLVAAANAGGSGSVIGDTTTTMMWIAGVPPASVLHAYVGAAVAFIVFGIPSSLQQQRYAPIMKDALRPVSIEWHHLSAVVWVLVCAAATNVIVNHYWPQAAERFPFIGIAVVIAMLLSVVVRQPQWSVLPRAFRSSVFLLALVASASLMPVDRLPGASWEVAFGLGFVSAVFDNIPLTALALRQGGYDWGVLAYAVGFGGSMIWFGSSAGVALSVMYPQAKSTRLWLLHGWHVALAYITGFAALMLALGWGPR